MFLNPGNFREGAHEREPLPEFFSHHCSLLTESVINERFCDLPEGDRGNNLVLMTTLPGKSILKGRIR